MSDPKLVQQVLEATPAPATGRGRGIALALVVAGVGGAVAIAASAGSATLWAALLTTTALAVGLGVFGPVLSAIFEMTGAKWGRAYRRIAEGSVVLIPVGLLGTVALIAGAGRYLPWVHSHLAGGKGVWLTRGFWSLRVLLALLLADLFALLFLYYSLRRDFCVAGVRERFSGRLAAWVSRGITDAAAEASRCSARLTTLAPVLAIVFALTFTLLGFDLIMALEPTWFSTLFGAWFFVGHLFAGLALLALASMALKAKGALAPWLTELRQRDLATLLFAFCLLNADFFWSQYLTIWYGNLPEETGYLISRTVDGSLPWRPLSWVSLLAFFLIPFIALVFRRVKHSRLLLSSVSIVVVAGVFLARFLEIAPPLLQVGRSWRLATVALPLAAATLLLLGMLGGGWVLHRAFLSRVPVMPVGDEVFAREFGPREGT